jgi:NADPH:quinone reductase-like Zn-dependent oxidoreductase/3-oxoacyl-(acyl-carrier-protein) synthase
LHIQQNNRNHLKHALTMFTACDPLLHPLPSPGAFHATANAVSVAAGRLSYSFALSGPSLSVDTACSASLVALHLAAAAMVPGWATPPPPTALPAAAGGAFVAGVHVQATSTSTMYVRAAGMLSPQGRCQVLEAAADGYVRGEACDVLLVAPAAAAGDKQPLAVILGSAVNQDGRSSSLTAPNGPAQQAVITAALSAAAVSADVVTMLSMHGTGTALGDPVEVNAAATVLLGSSGQREAPISLLASKSWHGHGEPAAGVIALQHLFAAAGQAARLPMLHLRTLNPYVAGIFDQLPQQQAGLGMSAARQVAPLPYAAAEGQVQSTSSFAFMGTNAHVVSSSSALGYTQAMASAGTGADLKWEHQRAWVAPAVHLLSRRVATARGPCLVLEADLAATQLSYLWQHVVSGRAVFPGAGYMAMAVGVLEAMAGDQLAAGGAALEGLTIPAALVLAAPGTAQPQLQCNVDLASGALTISSVASSGSTTLHMTASIGQLGQEPTSSNGSSLAAAAASLLVPLWPTKAAAVQAAGAVATAAPADHNDGTFLDVGLLDSFLQLGQVFILKQLAPGALYVPSGCQLLYVPPSNGATQVGSGLEMHAIPAAGGSSSAAVSDYALTNAQGCALLSIQGMAAKPMSRLAAAADAAAPSQAAAADASAKQLMYEVQWQCAEATAAGASQAADAALQLPATGPGLMAAALAAVQVAAAAAEQLSVMGLAAVAGAPAQPTPGMPGTAAQLAAMLRTYTQEVAGSNAAASFTAAAGSASSSTGINIIGSAQQLATDAYGEAAEGGVLQQPRLLLSAANEQLPRAFQMQSQPRGSLDDLVPVAVPTWHRAGDSEVLVAVKAVGVNFRDVLSVLGMYPGDPGAPGSDYSGLIVEGPGAGREVFGLSTGCLASHVVASAETLANKPPHISHEEAATTPTVLVTVQAALQQLAGLQPGETLLLHGAAGGVGLAAVQAAVAAGAQVFATASSPAKRALARSMGVRAAGSSRDTHFVTDLALAGGAHVLLNTLTSPGMLRGSLSALRLGARVVEISKRDIWGAAAIAAERPDVSYALLAVDFMPPGVLQQQLQQVSVALATGAAQPLRQVVHHMSHVRAALRQMAQTRHVGKVVVSNGSPGAWRGGPPDAAAGAGPGITHGTALVTGGTGALGVLVTGWLAQQVQHLVLVSRSGEAHEQLQQLLGAPNQLPYSCCITIASCDTGVRADVAGLAASVAFGSSHHPEVTAVLHAGGVLADAAVQNQTAAGLQQVMAPKVSGTALLHTYLLQAAPVSGTVLFSSVAALLGSAGQSNYAAANAALDVAAGQLTAAGLPVQSIQFGAWAGAGMAAATAAKARTMGVGALEPQQGLGALEAALSGSR